MDADGHTNLIRAEIRHIKSPCRKTLADLLGE